MPSSHLILCHPLLLLPPIPPSIRVFSNESTLHMRWPKYWNFSFSIIPSKEILGLISFRMDWLDLLAVQGTLKSLLQHHSSKASILRRSAFFTVQLPHPYMTTGKTLSQAILRNMFKIPQKQVSKSRLNLNLFSDFLFSTVSSIFPIFQLSPARTLRRRNTRLPGWLSSFLYLEWYWQSMLLSGDEVNVSSYWNSQSAEIIFLHLCFFPEETYLDFTIHQS